eukprot:9303927-Lingulodinium_polyedra.AAC.1
MALPSVRGLTTVRLPPSGTAPRAAPLAAQSAQGRGHSLAQTRPPPLKKCEDWSGGGTVVSG